MVILLTMLDKFKKGTEINRGSIDAKLLDEIDNLIERDGLFEFINAKGYQDISFINKQIDEQIFQMLEGTSMETKKIFEELLETALNFTKKLAEEGNIGCFATSIQGSGQNDSNREKPIRPYDHLHWLFKKMGILRK